MAAAAAGANIRALMGEYNSFDKVQGSNWAIFQQRLADSIAMDFQEAKAEWIMAKTTEMADLDWAARKLSVGDAPARRASAHAGATRLERSGRATRVRQHLPFLGRLTARGCVL